MAAEVPKYYNSNMVPELIKDLFLFLASPEGTKDGGNRFPFRN